MMLPRPILVPLMIAFTAAACGERGPDAPRGPSITHDEDGVEIVEYSELPREATWLLGAEPLVSIGVDIGDEPYMFTSIGDVQLLADGALVVAEWKVQEVRIFDRGGSFLRSFGSKGQGPGAFENLARTAVREGEILAWDAAGRLSRFTLVGDLIETIRTNNIGGNPNVDVQGFFGDGSLLVALGKYTMSRDAGTYRAYRVSETLVRWSPDDPQRVETVTTVDSGRGLLANEIGLGVGAPLVAVAGRAAGPGNVYVTPGDVFEYRRYGLDGVLERIVRVAESAEVITADDIEEITAALIQSSDERDREALRRIYAEITFPENFPMVDELFVDAERHVWLRRYRRPQAENDQIFHVFDRDGIFVGTVHLPADLDFRMATRDRLIGRWRDEMEVQSVRVYELDRR